MITGILIVLAVVLALLSLKFLWDWRRSGRMLCVSLPRRYRDRDSQQVIWRERYGQDKLSDIEAVLISLCKAFSFHPDDRYQFTPGDQVMDIYRACYPGWKFWHLGDSMELESLLIDLNKQYGLALEDWRPNLSLADLVELAVLKNNPPSP